MTDRSPDARPPWWYEWTEGANQARAKDTDAASLRVWAAEPPASGCSWAFETDELSTPATYSDHGDVPHRDVVHADYEDEGSENVDDDEHQL